MTINNANANSFEILSLKKVLFKHINSNLL